MSNLSPSGLANLVLEDTVERIYAGNTFAEKWCGLFLIRGENVVLLGEIVGPLSPSCLSLYLTLTIAHRIWIKKMTFHYVRLITSNSMITIDRTWQRRSRGKKQRRRFCMSKKGSARKGGREMDIEIHHYGFRFPADSLSPRGSGDSHWLYTTLQVTYYTTLSSRSRLMTLRPNEEVTTNGSSEGSVALFLPFLTLLRLIPIGLMLWLSIDRRPWQNRHTR